MDDQVYRELDEVDGEFNAFCIKVFNEYWALQKFTQELQAGIRNAAMLHALMSKMHNHMNAMSQVYLRHVVEIVGQQVFGKWVALREQNDRDD